MSQRRAKGAPETAQELHERRREELPPALFEGHMFLLAFFDTLEQQRLAGDVLGWRATRGPEDVCRLEVLTPDGQINGEGKTWGDAHRSLVDHMIETGMRIARAGEA